MGEKRNAVTVVILLVARRCLVGSLLFIRLGDSLQCRYVLARMTFGVKVIVWTLKWFYLVV